ncbi:MAG: Fis family transcriptional regulator [Betaproteobacteria bacterium]|nr:Fis family transcriptional regulator [Betaproteobacteria bacterium]
MAKANKHRGSNFDGFLREQELFEEVQAAALKRAIAEALAESMDRSQLTKVELAKRMRTSRSQLDRLFDPNYTSVQLDTLIKAASALGKELRFSLKNIAVA